MEGKEIDKVETVTVEEEAETIVLEQPKGEVIGAHLVDPIST